MSRSKNSSSPPQVMTWGKAMPTLSLCVVFDALRFIFVQFWFFGPLLAGAAVGAATSDVPGSSLLAGATTGVVGYVGGPALAVFGAVMAMAVGFLGWLTTGFVLMLRNARIFKQNASGWLTLLLGLGISELPFIGALPALTGTTWKLYHTQIKKEKKEFKEWQAAVAQESAQERAAYMAELLEAREAYAHAEEEEIAAETQAQEAMAAAEEEIEQQEAA